MLAGKCQRRARNQPLQLGARPQGAGKGDGADDGADGQLDKAGGVDVADGADAVVIATPHHEFKILNFPKWLSNTRTVVLDTANVVSADERMICRNSGIRIESIGRGDGL